MKSSGVVGPSVWADVGVVRLDVGTNIGLLVGRPVGAAVLHHTTDWGGSLAYSLEPK